MLKNKDIKLSKFNTALTYQDKYIFHNSFTENFLLLEPILMDLINSAELEENVVEIKEVHPTLYNSLLDNGFIVPKDEDEILKVENLINKIDKSDELFSLMILPTMDCNFKCWYCYETHISGSMMAESTVEKVKLFITNTFNTMNNLKHFHLSFFGGEPLLQYNNVVRPIVECTYNIAKEKGISLHTHFTSNGVLINDIILSDLIKHEVNSFQITLDGNKECHDQIRYVSKEKGSFDTIISNVKKLVINNTKVTLRFNYTSDNIDGIVDIMPHFEDLTLEERSRITLDMQRVWQENKTEGLGVKANTIKEMFLKFGFNLPHARSLNSLRNSCYADRANQATINYNGDIHKCNARDFKKANKEGILGNDGTIDWNEKYYNRLNVKLKNKPCLDCSILPMCGGACSQYALERSNTDFCIRDFDESKKKAIVLDMFLNGEFVMTEKTASKCSKC
ncbi:radical SAM/SPASM domain-containing protein [Williamwhitmania taraxaci]|nr:radical SAM protein [Williamwhitmania taraxaci]